MRNQTSLGKNFNRTVTRSAHTALAVFALTLLAASAQAAGTLAPGAAFPALANLGLEGKLPDLTNAKVVVIDFWASWCGPCKASFPVYDELQREFGPKGVVIIAVNVDKDVKAMQAFLDRTKPSFATVRDASQRLVQAAGVPTMPTSFVLDAKGTVRFVHAGFHGDATRREYVQQFNTILGE